MLHIHMLFPSVCTVWHPSGMNHGNRGTGTGGPFCMSAHRYRHGSRRPPPSLERPAPRSMECTLDISGDSSGVMDFLCNPGVHPGRYPQLAVLPQTAPARGRGLNAVKDHLSPPSKARSGSALVRLIIASPLTALREEVCFPGGKGALVPSAPPSPHPVPSP